MPASPNGGAPTSQTSLDSAGDAICQSFALGWQMARLYSSPLRGSQEPNLEDDLPGLSRLPSGQLVILGLDQADAAIRVLSAFLESSGINLPTTTKVRTLLGAARAARENDDLRRAILALHVELLTALTAADFRCGKAYGLGRALADTSSASQSAKELDHHLESHRAAELIGWLSDLKTRLPDHAAEAVSRSLAKWIEWAEANPRTSMTDEEIHSTSRVLHEQGQRWRALLSGEKDASDTLHVEDYVKVARLALKRSAAIGGEVVKSLWPPIALAGALLVLGIVLMVVYSSGARVIAGLGTIVVSLGITWRSAASSLAQLARRLEQPIWGGELDDVIGERIKLAFPAIEPVAEAAQPATETDTVILSDQSTVPHE